MSLNYLPWVRQRHWASIPAGVARHAHNLNQPVTGSALTGRAPYGDSPKMRATGGRAAVVAAAAVALCLVGGLGSAGAAATTRTEPAATGLPDRLFKPRVGTPDVRDEPIQAASVLLEGLDDQWAMVSADGTAYRELHARTHRHAPPALSPDGRRIAWWEERGRDDPEAWELHVLRLADGHETTLLPDVTDRSPALSWFPDSRRLLALATAADGRQTTWVADADAGTERVLCRCGQRMVVSTSGTIVHVPGFPGRPAAPEDPPAGVTRLPEARIDDAVVVSPDARSWAAVQWDVPNYVLVVGGLGGATRTTQFPEGPYGVNQVLAWTADGIWLDVGEVGIVLFDPASGARRTVTPSDYPHAASIATDVAAGASTVHAQPPPVDVVAEARHEAAGFLALLHYVFVWLPMHMIGPVGYAVVVGILSGLLAFWIVRAHHMRRMRAMQNTPAHARTTATTKTHG
jgi:hypothetical protein